jgi:hypothetical protein
MLVTLALKVSLSRSLINPSVYREAHIGLFAKILLTLTNNKWPLGIDPDGHHFVVLNVSIIKKLFSLSLVVLLTHPFLMLYALFKDTVVT